MEDSTHSASAHSHQGLHHWTTPLFALAGILFLAAQLHGALQERQIIKSQLSTLQQQVEQGGKSLSQSEEAWRQREAQMKNASTAEARYAALLTELLDLAKTDADALLVIQKWKIQKQGEQQAQPQTANTSADGNAKPAASAPKPTKAPQTPPAR